MKKIFSALTLVSIVLCSVLGFAGCSKAEEKNVDLTAVMKEISDKAQMPEETLDIENAEDLLEYYSIDAAKAESYAIRINASGYQDEIVMVKAVDDDSAKDIETILKDKLEDSMEAMKNYSPEQYAILEKTTININGRYVSMFVSEDAETMLKIYNSYFG